MNMKGRGRGEAARGGAKMLPVSGLQSMGWRPSTILRELWIQAPSRRYEQLLLKPRIVRTSKLLHSGRY